MRDPAIETTGIPGLLVVRLGLQYNDDGWFKEDWHRAKMTALGLPDFDPVQHNVTHVVARGITRGFLAEPWDRMVSLLRGRAMGAWVDLRAGVGFGRTFTYDLSPGTAVFVPRGVGNAHQVLEDDTTFSYLLEHHWTPQARNRYSSVDLFDPALGITWPIGRDRAIVAHRDTLHPLLSDATPMQPRRTLVVGTETGLGRALAAAMPGATGMTTAALAPDAVSSVDLSAYDMLVAAHGHRATNLPDRARKLGDGRRPGAPAHRHRTAPPPAIRARLQRLRVRARLPHLRRGRRAQPVRTARPVARSRRTGGGRRSAPPDRAHRLGGRHRRGVHRGGAVRRPAWASAGRGRRPVRTPNLRPAVGRRDHPPAGRQRTGRGLQRHRRWAGDLVGRPGPAGVPATRGRPGAGA